jgi:hypothetical protein
MTHKYRKSYEISYFEVLDVFLKASSVAWTINYNF